MYNYHFCFFFEELNRYNSRFLI